MVVSHRKKHEFILGGADVKTLGVIGGLGPMATAYLLQLIIEMTDARTDQEHLDVIVFDRPGVPDRTAAILDPAKPSPVPSMQATARTLESLGAGVLCAPCVTSHYFYDQLAGSVNIPWIHMVRETAAELARAGRKKPGILATTGTVTAGLFQQALEGAGLAWAVPSTEGQARVMSLIYDDIKAGRLPNEENFAAVTAELRDRGCDCLILGCTELSLIKKRAGLDAGYLDALEVLAKRCVEACGAPLRREYNCLI